jgi:hypothetical protein
MSRNGTGPRRTQLPPDEMVLRKALFVPCKTKAGLGLWVKTYLGLDLPDCIVDPDSTSSPLDALWELYYAALTNSEEHAQVLVFAARDSYKTIIASIIEVLCLVHLDRSVAHMAAIESQAKKAQEYGKSYFSKPFLRDFKTSSNERLIEVTWYSKVNASVTDVITLSEFNKLPPHEKNVYEEHKQYIQIVVCTVAGANSSHTNFMVVDELDVIPNKEAYEESKFIPSARDGKLPITLLTSTRKYSWSLVQKEIDAAPETGLKLLHWNIIDVTQSCSPELHQPEQGRIPIYWSPKTLKSISDKDYDALPSENQDDYRRDIGYVGCLKNCNLFALCRGRLATDQGSKSPLLKPIKLVQNLVRSNPLAKVKTQMMCWQPQEEGRVYTQFDPDVHMLTASQIAEKLTGDTYDADFTKQQLLNLAVSMGLPFYAGIDFGFSHQFAVAMGFVALNKLYIVHCISASKLGPTERLAVCNDTIKPFNPAIFADVAEPASIKFFRQAGYTMRNWIKQKNSVIDGIEIVRFKLSPTGEEPELYLLRDDDGCDMLANGFKAYHWMVDAAGKTLGVPDQDEDDLVDAMRYLVMNVFPPRGRNASVSGPTDGILTTPGFGSQAENWMSRVIQANLDPDQLVSDGLRIKRGGFLVDI